MQNQQQIQLKEGGLCNLLTAGKLELNFIFNSYIISLSLEV